jgi:hypothetical protein
MHACTLVSADDFGLMCSTGVEVLVDDFQLNSRERHRVDHHLC